MKTPTVSPSTAMLEDIGLYNLLTRIALGHTDVDPLLLLTLRDKGFLVGDTLSLSHDGEQMLQGLTVRFGWFYPEV